MTITVDLKREIQAELARQSAARGCAIEAYVASVLEEAIHVPGVVNGTVFDKDRAQAAADRIRELRKDVTLGGLTVRHLIDQGRP